jgi:5-methylcytosine-specific restriction protein A
MLVQGEVYRRRDLHKQFGGQQQGGISTPGRHRVVLLFTGEAGEQYGYRDGWSNGGIFLYTGEGQHGDMRFSRGNVAIRDHPQQGRDLHLFEYIKGDRKGFVRYIDQMVCTGFSFRDSPDTTGKR